MVLYEEETLGSSFSFGLSLCYIENTIRSRRFAPNLRELRQESRARMYLNVETTAVANLVKPRMVKVATAR